jgi:hypothetical protein
MLKTKAPLIALLALAGCSSAPPPAKEAVKAPDKIQGKAIVDMNDPNPVDAALNAGGPSVYLVSGLTRYRLFLTKAAELKAGQEYVAEGVYAQKAIDAIGDPDNGKNGYPLESSCDRVVKMAWPGLAFDVTDSYTKSLRAKIKRFPARPVFLVTSIEPVTGSKKEEAEEKEAPTVSVPADKQKALLLEGSTELTAPLFEPAGGTAKCKVVVGEDGKIAELNSGSQLCESVDWSKFRYKPTMKGAKAAKVETEVEVHFGPRK